MRGKNNTLFVSNLLLFLNLSLNQKMENLLRRRMWNISIGLPSRKGEKISKGMAIFANRGPSTREIVSSVGLLFKFHPFESYSSHLPPYIRSLDRAKRFIYRSVYSRATTWSWNLVVRFVLKEIGRIGQVVKRKVKLGSVIHDQ